MGFYDESTFVQAKILPEDDKIFEKEAREILLITNDYSGGAIGKTAQMDILAAIDVQTNELNPNEGRIEWETTEEEYKAHAFFDRFKKGTVYRILARKLKREEINPQSTEQFNNRYYVVKVLEEGVRNDKLEEILKEYRKEVAIEDDTLGKFILNKDLEMFDGSAEINGEEITLQFDVDKNDPDTWKAAHANLKKFVSEIDRWDKEMREFSAEQLTELANDWLADETYDDDEEPEEITEEAFAERIGLCEISLDAEGEFIVYYSDDDMFWGHSIEVSGTLEEGIESADMVG